MQEQEPDYNAFQLLFPRPIYFNGLFLLWQRDVRKHSKISRIQIQGYHILFKRQLFRVCMAQTETTRDLTFKCAL